MHPRTVTILLGCALAAASCTSPSGRTIASIPALETTDQTVTDTADGPVARPFVMERAVLASTAVADDAEPQRRRRREPQRRRERRFSAYGMLSFAGGDYDFEDDALGRDDTRAYMQRIQAAGANHQGIGGGIDFKFIVPTDDVYEGTINVTDVSQSDLYAFFLAHVSGGNFRMPVRVGPYFSQVRAEFEVTDDETFYDSLGIRVEIEPEVVIVEGDGNSEASLYTRLSVGVNDTFIDDESTDEHYHSHGFTLGLEAGMRFVIGRVAFSAAYVYHENTISESDDENGLVIPRLETYFDGIQFAAGVRF